MNPNKYILLFVLIPFLSFSQTISRFAFNPIFNTSQRLEYSIGAIVPYTFQKNNFIITSDFIQPENSNKAHKKNTKLIQKKHINIFPNPFQQKINLLINYPQGFQNIKITVVNTYGQIILQKNIFLNRKITYINIPFTLETKSGIYLLNILFDSQYLITYKIIKQ